MSGRDYDDECWEPGFDPGPCGEDDYGDRERFAEPGGDSALHAAGEHNPRIHPCPNCGEPEVLTPLDVARGYQCDGCADRAERG